MPVFFKPWQSAFRTVDGSVPVTVLAVTKHAAPLLARCLAALKPASEIIVIDTPTGDDTQALAQQHGATYVPFVWNGCYPKKRQWVLENVPTRHAWVLFVDADEVVPEALWQEIAAVMKHPRHAAYFVAGQPVWEGIPLRHGRWHRKIILCNKNQTRFPVMDDADCADMGEIEGHYQPEIAGSIGNLRTAFVHYCADDIFAWRDKHRRYARWQALVKKRGNAVAHSEQGLRFFLKKVFHALPGKYVWAFVDSYILKGGFADGRPGYRYAVSRGFYYWLVASCDGVKSDTKTASSS